MIYCNKSPLTILGKVAVGDSHCRNYQNFSGHPYTGCIAWPSLR